MLVASVQHIDSTIRDITNCSLQCVLSPSVNIIDYISYASHLCDLFIL